jgi:outer membrane protein assembly factor BamD (BamD/ComL family)
MFKWIATGAALIIALMLSWHAVLANGVLIRYLDAHPESRLAPAAPLYAAHFYFSLRQYESARRYFEYVSRRFPRADEGEEAEFYALHCRRLVSDISLAEMVPYYTAFVQHYPDGRYTDSARKLIDEGVRRAGT